MYAISWLVWTVLLYHNHFVVHCFRKRHLLQCTKLLEFYINKASKIEMLDLCQRRQYEATGE